MIHLFLFTLLAFHAPAKESSACKLVLQVEGQKMGGVGFNHELRVCEKSKDFVLVQIDYGSQPTRSISLPKKTYEQYLKGAQNTVVDLKKIPESKAPCHHTAKARLSWDQVTGNISSCDGDARSVLVKKFADLMRDIYYENSTQ